MSLSPVEIIERYTINRYNRRYMYLSRLFFLAILGGFLVATGAGISMIATYAIENPSLRKIISGLIFPTGLAIIMLLGAELFTGNCMILINLYQRSMRTSSMFRNLMIVYLGNFIGAIIFTFLFSTVVFESKEMMEYAISIAISKITTPWIYLFIKATLCNIFVCIGVLCSLSATDTTGRILGAYLPVSLFVIGGFEHCIANMYFIPMGIISSQILHDGMDQFLTWTRFFSHNLIIVTFGNIIGGFLFSLLMWNTYKFDIKPIGR